MIEINTLIGGNIEINTGSSSSEHAETIFTFTGDVTISKNISGELNPFDYDDVGQEVFDYDGSEKLYRKDLVSIDIGNTVTSIGASAFENCNGLTGALAIPDCVTSIGEYAFYGCRSLTSVTIPNGVPSIGERAFSNCLSITSFTIPNSVTSIGGWAFYGCSGLTSITIGENVTNIGEQAFTNCGELTSMTIPNSVTNIGVSAFYECSSLTSVTFQGKTMEQVQNIEDEYGYKHYPWGISDTSIINVA